MKRFAFVLWFSLFGGFAAAQTIPSPVLLIDSEVLYKTSIYAIELQRDIVEAYQIESAESRRMEDALRSEELKLTELRRTLSPEAFAEAAQAFDERAEEARRAAAEIQRQANADLAEQRRVFFNRVRPIIGQIMVERGATLVLQDGAAVFMKFNILDITEIARARIDAELATAVPETAAEE